MAVYSDLDRTDFEILRLLQKDARLTNKELALAIDLAPSSAHERVKRLWEIGVLRGLHAEVDPRALGVGIEALLMVELSKHKRSNVDAFVQAVGEIPEVRSAFLLTGRWDVVVHVVARDMAHLKDLALDKFTNQPGVTRIETAIVYDAKRRHEVPLIQGTEQ
jgi:DNA-binding Lrp family transcriptional regulator